MASQVRQPGHKLQVIQHRAVLATVAIGMLITLGTAAAFFEFEKIRQQDRFLSEAARYRNDIGHRLANRFLKVRGLRSLYESSTNVVRDEFATFARIQQENMAGILALWWIPRVTAEDRNACEIGARYDGLKSFAIWELSDCGNAVSAPRRETYFPILFLEPYRGNESFPGYNLGSVPRLREAMTVATDEDRLITLPSTVLLSQEAKAIPDSLLCLLPTFRRGNTAFTQQGRREQLAGFIGGIFSISDIVQIEPFAAEFGDIRVQVWDQTGISPCLIYDSCPEATQPAASHKSHPAEWRFEDTIALDALHWRFQIDGHPGDFAATTPASSWWSLLIGSALTSLLSLYLRDVRQRAEHVETMVSERTSELSEATDRVNQLAEHSRTLTWEVDADGLFTYITDVSKQVLGYGPEELVGHLHFYDLHPAESRDQFKAETLEVFRRQDPITGLQNPVVAKSGEVVWMSTTGIPVLNEDGTLLGYRGSDTDISKLKQTEDFLSHERERLANVIRGTNVGTWEWNVQTGEVVFNERWAEICGYTLEELAPTSFETWLALAHPDDVETSKALLERHFAGEHDVYDFECRMKHKDGHWVWIHDLGRLISRTENGEPLMMIGTHADISDRKAAEEAVRESEKFLQEVFDGIQDGLSVIDTNLEILQVNQWIESIHGDGQPIVGRKCYEVYHDRKTPCPRCPVLDCMNSGRFARRS
jgi:PAS domain S-box-containing protein